MSRLLSSLLFPGTVLALTLVGCRVDSVRPACFDDDGCPSGTCQDGVCVDEGEDTSVSPDTETTPDAASDADAAADTGRDADVVDPLCGDGTIDDGEDCDDGNNTSGDGCSATCESEGEGICGDGVKDEDEECDDGNQLSGDGCDDMCFSETVCGDGVSEGPEDATMETPTPGMAVPPTAQAKEGGSAMTAPPASVSCSAATVS